MYYLRARFYNQISGRFWNQDSYEGSSGDPASLHKYLYANADPVMCFDPSGKITLGEIAIAAGINGIISGMISAAVNWGRTGSDFWSEVGKDAGLGILTAPIGGALTAGIAKVLGPIAKIAMVPFFRMIARIPPQVLTGSKSAIERIMVRIGRHFFRTTATYPSVESTLLGSILKRFFPSFDWEMHHIFIQQAWSRAGSASQVFVDDVLANEGLRRIGNGFWNLVPLPAAVNSAFRSPWFAGVFASLYYGTAVWGADFVAETIYDELQ